MPAALPTAFFPSRQSSRLEKKSHILDVEEATGAPRLTAADAFGPESRNGLLCGGDPVNNTDPTGLLLEEPKKKDGPGGGNPFAAFPQGQGISTAGWWGGKPGGNDFYSGSGTGLSMGFVGRDGGGAPAGRNPDGTPILRALPLNNTIGVLGVGTFNWRTLSPTWQTAGNMALFAMMRGVGSVIFRNYLHLTLQGLSSSGATSATLVGYSRGAVVAANEAGRFGSMSFNMVGIDGVTIGIPGRSIRLPSNVVSATNYYQQNPHNYFDSSRPFIGSPMHSSHINVANHNWTGGAYSHVDHNTIVDEVRYRHFPGGY